VVDEASFHDVFDALPVVLWLKIYLFIDNGRSGPWTNGIFLIDVCARLDETGSGSFLVGSSDFYAFRKGVLFAKARALLTFCTGRKCWVNFPKVEELSDRCFSFEGN